jgi:hypothetical protein
VPAEARGHVRKLPSGKWQLRYYDKKGGHRSGGAFPTKSEAWAHYRDVVEPELRGRVVRRDITLSELVDTFLDRHGKIANPRTIRTLRERLKRPQDDYGDTARRVRKHDGRTGRTRASLPERYRYSACRRRDRRARRQFVTAT